jgi:hypothetical protein
VFDLTLAAVIYQDESKEGANATAQKMYEIVLKSFVPPITRWASCQCYVLEMIKLLQ